MSDPTLTSQDLIAWHETTFTNWRKLLLEHPHLLTQPCDIAKSHTIGELLQHIVAVELRYAERLADLPTSDFAAIPFDTVESIFATHDRASAIFRDVLASNPNWDESIEYLTRSYGPARSTRKTIFLHAHLHSIRHFAQLSTLARQHGVQPQWPMDYIFMDIEKV